MPPPIPVTVMVVPLGLTAAENEALTVTDPDWPGWMVRVSGENVTPVGKAEKVTAIGWLKPL